LAAAHLDVMVVEHPVQLAVKLKGDTFFQVVNIDHGIILLGNKK